MARGNTSARRFGRKVRSVNTWIAFGAPKTITTNQNTQFESQLFKALSNLLGCERTRTTAYHTAANEIIARWLIKSCNTLSRIEELVTSITNSFIGTTYQHQRRHKNYSSRISIWYHSTTFSPAEHFFNEDFTPESQIFLSHFREHMRNLRSTHIAHDNKKRMFIHGTLYTCTHVFVRIDRITNSLDSPYEGIYPISERIIDRIFKIIVNGEAVNNSVDRFKPAFIEAIPDEQQRPSRTHSEQTNENLKVYPGKRISFATLLSRVT